MQKYILITARTITISKYFEFAHTRTMQMADFQKNIIDSLQITESVSRMTGGCKLNCVSKEKK